MVSVIIPAFNEAKTVALAVAEARRHPVVDEVIVVDDGSADETAAEAAAAGARVLRLARNGGKASALEAGVRAARHHVLLFLDADVTGHSDDAFSRIVQPVLEGRFEMYVGIHTRRTLWLNDLLYFFPIISGERALTRRLWDAVPLQHKTRFQIEIALNHAAKRFERGMGFELIPGTAHHTKEEKYGFWVGFWRRQRMVADVLAISLRLYVFDTLRRVGRTASSKLDRRFSASPVLSAARPVTGDTSRSARDYGRETTLPSVKDSGGWTMTRTPSAMPSTTERSDPRRTSATG